MRKNALKTILLAAAALAAVSVTGCAQKQPEAAHPVETTKAKGTAADYQAAIDALDPKKPETLGTVNKIDYSDITVEVPEKQTVTAEGAESALEEMMAEYTKEADVIEDGDTVDINFVGKKDGVAFEGGTAEHYSLTIGSGRFIDGFEIGLVGVKKGETVTLNLTFPENYGNADLAGQPVTFDVTVNSIQRPKTLADLDDAFAHEIDEESNTVEELKTRMVDSMQKTLDNLDVNNIQSEVIRAVIEKSDVVPTEEAIEWTIDNMIVNYYVPYFNTYGITLANYLFSNGLTYEGMREDLRESSELMVKQMLITDAIAEEQGFTADDEGIAAYAATLGTDAESLKSTADAETLETSVKELKALEFLASKATVTRKAPETAAETTAAAN